MTAVDAGDALQLAIAALKVGNKVEARRLLDGLLAADRYNEQAWLWMSGVVDSDAERIICLENVLTLNPYNERARQGLEKLGRQPPPVPIAPLVVASPPPALTHLSPYVSPPPAVPPAAVAPPRPQVADYRLYITLVIVLSLLLICTVAGIVVAVLFLAPAA